MTALMSLANLPHILLLKVQSFSQWLLSYQQSNPCEFRMSERFGEKSGIRKPLYLPFVKKYNIYTFIYFYILLNTLRYFLSLLKLLTGMVSKSVVQITKSLFAYSRKGLSLSASHFSQLLNRVHTVSEQRLSQLLTGSVLSFNRVHPISEQGMSCLLTRSNLVLNRVSPDFEQGVARLETGYSLFLNRVQPVSEQGHMAFSATPHHFLSGLLMIKNIDRRFKMAININFLSSIIQRTCFA